MSYVVKIKRQAKRKFFPCPGEHDPSTGDLQVQLMKLRRDYESRIEPHVFKYSEFNNSNPMAVEIIKNSLEI